MMHMMRWLATSFLFALAVGCGGGDEVEIPPPVDPTELTYAPELAVDLASMTRTESGLYWQDLYEGQGSTARPNRTVTVEFTIWLHDGQRVSGSSDSGNPPTFALGSDDIIPAWNEGIEGMREGGRRKLVVPPHLGFGTTGSAGIPPNATVVMTLELVDVQ